MAGGFVEFGAALVAFIGSHAVAGLPGIRGRLLARLGERTYRIVYSVVSLALLTWVISAAIRAPYVGLWGPFPGTTALLVAVMAPASVLLAASVVEPTPFSLSFARGRFDPARPGTAGLIRHPLPLAFALWAGAHLIANGDAVQAALPALLSLSLPDRCRHQAADTTLDRGFQNSSDHGLADGAAEHAERLRRQGAGRRRGQHPAPRCTAGRHCPQRGNGGGGVVRRQAMRPHDRDQRMG